MSSGGQNAYSAAGTYGAGGVGGGEATNDTFSVASEGGPGYCAFCAIIYGKSIASSKLKVKVDNVDHVIQNISKPFWLDYAMGTTRPTGSWSPMKKITLSLPTVGVSNSNYRSYSLSPFTAGDSGVYAYHEFLTDDYITDGDSFGYADNVKVVKSKAVHNNEPLKVLYCTDSDEPLQYVRDIITGEVVHPGRSVTTSYESDCPSFYINPGESVDIYALAQGAGGGGGGGDNYWALFNYAAGGGGGAGGTAAICKFHYENTTTSSKDIYVEMKAGVPGEAGTTANAGSNSSTGNGGSDGTTSNVTIHVGSYNSFDGWIQVAGGGAGSGGSNKDGGAGGGIPYVYQEGNSSWSGSYYDVYDNSTSLVTELLTVIRGGDGGYGASTNTTGYNGHGTTLIVNNNSTYSIPDGILANGLTLTIDTSSGSGGNTGSQDCRGGGGGASWLGNGGYYTRT